jgi:hypothetical protein
VKAARPRSEPEVSRGNTGIDSNLGEGRAVTLEPYPTIPPRLNQLPWNEIRAATTANSQEGVGSGPWGFGSIQEGVVRGDSGFVRQCR